MKKLLIALAAVVIATVASYGQGAVGQVVFANKVGTAVDAPVTVLNSNPLQGPGPTYVAQLYLANADGSAGAALGTPATFRAAGTGAAAIADRYWVNQTVDVTGHAPGDAVSFLVRAWASSAGSYDAAQQAGRGQSNPFTVTIGGGTLPPANLTTLQAFTVTAVPEPSVIALGVLGAAALALRRRK
jgi:hypothetical protein